MAVIPRDIRITRTQLTEWVEEWGKIKKSERPTLRDFLDQRPEIQELPDRMVHVAARDDIRGDDLDIVDYILLDIDTFLDKEKVSATQIG